MRAWTFIMHYVNEQRVKILSTIYEKSILTLELPAVLEKIAQYAVSDGAKERIRAIRPYRYLEDIRIRTLGKSRTRCA